MKASDRVEKPYLGVQQTGSRPQRLVFFEKSVKV
jgi:hypothetical protein